MLTCPQCHESYPAGTATCPRDGAVLDTEAARSAATVEAPPGPGPKVPTTPARRMAREDALSPTLRQDDLAAKELTGSSKERVAARGEALQRPDAMVGRRLVDRFEITR